MFGDEGYTQFVGLLKISLPMAALGLMSTVFLFARAPSQENAIPYAEIEEIARESRLSGARLSGISSDGSTIEVNARYATPQGPLLSVEALKAEIESTDGTLTEITAGSGEINNSDRTARLSGLIHITTSNGFDMETAGATADLKTGRIVSDGALEVQTPFGSLTAGQLIIETPEDSPGQVMLFQNGVRLIYTPQQ